MPLALLIRLRPAGAWRPGSDSGARDRVDRICHSDTLYSAISSAMVSLGWTEEWFSATARAAEVPAVRVTSLFPALGHDLLAPAPATLWPPPNLTRLRARGAKLIPARIVATVASGEAWKEENWEVDGLSECLVRRGHRAEHSGPFRIALRTRAAVDRLDHGSIAIHQTACLEFAPNAGLWCAAVFAGEEARALWTERVEACFRLLADSGLGGERSNGWGRFSVEKMESGDLRDLILGPPETPKPLAQDQDHGEEPQPLPEQSHWLLSLFNPAPSDQIDWTRGCYSFLDRSGRMESPSEWGRLNRSVRMVREGSVLLSPATPVGIASDVAPEGFSHPVYRAGFAVTLPLPWKVNA